MGSNIKHRQNVGMIQGRRSQRLLLKPAQPVPVERKRRRQNLDRNFPLEASVARPINLAHPARTQRRNNFIRTKPRARGKIHKRPIITQPESETSHRGNRSMSGKVYVGRPSRPSSQAQRGVGTRFVSGTCLQACRKTAELAAPSGAAPRGSSSPSRPASKCQELAGSAPEVPATGPVLQFAA